MCTPTHVSTPRIVEFSKNAGRRKPIQAGPERMAVPEQGSTSPSIRHRAKRSSIRSHAREYSRLRRTHAPRIFARRTYRRAHAMAKRYTRRVYIAADALRNVRTNRVAPLPCPPSNRCPRTGFTLYIYIHRRVNVFRYYFTACLPFAQMSGLG